MATPRDIRRLAFQALYQLDARVAGPGGASAATAPIPADINPDDAAAVLAGLIDDPDDPGSAAANYTTSEIKKAFLMATGAFTGRAAADAFMTEAAPTWPAHRQAAVDRAILRLAHYEMTLPDGQGAHPKVVVNEAVELAKTFSTEKSPAFVNGLLDKLLKQVWKEEESGSGVGVSGSETEASGSGTRVPGLEEEHARAEQSVPQHLSPETTA